jgi:hypothetical protein
VLRSLKGIERYRVSATDGDIGSVVTFLLDDQRWVIRYLVFEKGSFLEKTSSAHFAPLLSRGGLALAPKSPGIDVDKSVSRQHEEDYCGYYGYPYYWRYSGLWGTSPDPALLAPYTTPTRSTPLSEHTANVLRTGAKR